jgi:hypothetical protein
MWITVLCCAGLLTGAVGGSAFCGELFSAPEAEQAPSESGSFYHRALSGKYNLLEDDFSDVPHRTSRYDYIKESIEENRLFSRPDGPEFALLNVQFDSGRLYINDFQTFSGSAKQKRAFVHKAGHRFFYRLKSRNNKTVLEKPFEIPLNLHYDFINPDTGTLAGGMLEREEGDFVLKIPLKNKDAQKIIFYRDRAPRVFDKSRRAGSEPFAGAEKAPDVIGEVQF